jgi:hypothetical protein
MRSLHYDCTLNVTLKNCVCTLHLASVSTPVNYSKSVAKVEAEAASPHNDRYYNPSLSLLTHIIMQGPGYGPSGSPTCTLMSLVNFSRHEDDHSATPDQTCTDAKCQSDRFQSTHVTEKKRSSLVSMMSFSGTYLRRGSNLISPRLGLRGILQRLRRKGDAGETVPLQSIREPYTKPLVQTRDESSCTSVEGPRRFSQHSMPAKTRGPQKPLCATFPRRCLSGWRG